LPTWFSCPASSRRAVLPEVLHVTVRYICGFFILVLLVSPGVRKLVVLLNFPKTPRSLPSVVVSTDADGDAAGDDPGDDAPPLTSPSLLCVDSLPTSSAPGRGGKEVCELFFLERYSTRLSLQLRVRLIRPSGDVPSLSVRPDPPYVACILFGGNALRTMGSKRGTGDRSLETEETGDEDSERACLVREFPSTAMMIGGGLLLLCDLVSELPCFKGALFLRTGRRDGGGVRRARCCLLAGESTASGAESELWDDCCGLCGRRRGDGT
jgi:hypothetical protein